MVSKTHIGIGVLILILLSSGVIYVEWSDNARLRIDDDKTSFYVPHEDYSWMWVVSGREYNKLIDGTSNMNRITKEITVENFETENGLTIIRTTPYIRGPIIRDIYYFDGNIKDIELFPISHKVEVINATGYYYKYEVRDLVYNGDTFKFDGEQISQEFGRNMKVTWWDNYRLGWVYKTGSMYVKSEKIESDYEVFDVRLFDPVCKEFSYVYEKETKMIQIYKEEIIYPDSIYVEENNTWIDVSPYTIKKIIGYEKIEIATNKKNILIDGKQFSEANIQYNTMAKWDVPLGDRNFEEFGRCRDYELAKGICKEFDLCNEKSLEVIK